MANPADTMSGKKFTSGSQIAILLDYMERYGDMSRLGLGEGARTRNDNLWLALVRDLNSDGSGSSRSAQHWKKVWSDYKTRVKKKACNIRDVVASGGPAPTSPLTDFEKRVLGVMGIRGRFKNLDSENSLATSEQNDEEREEGEVAEQEITLPQATSNASRVEVVYIMPSEDPIGMANLSSVPNVPLVSTSSRTTQTASQSEPQPSRKGQRTRATSPKNETYLPIPFRPRPRRIPKRRQSDKTAALFAKIELKRLKLDKVKEDNRRDEELKRLELEKRRIELAERFVVVCEQGFVFKQSLY